MHILVINCGSSSIKYQVIDTDQETALLSGNIDRIGIDKDYELAMASLLKDVSPFTLDAIGHRVVHGGERFRRSVRIDDDVIRAINDCSRLAPLHNPRNLDGIRATRHAFPGLPQVAVFDTAFHMSLPEAHYSYALPSDLMRKHGVRRYGFHGTSHQYVAAKAAEALKRPITELRLITLHLGNGASACAVEFGHSIETSMGMTPTEGLIMGTRCGDIDPGALLYLMNAEGMSTQSADELLNKRSGLSGLSGLSPDVRELEKAASHGHEGARLALAAFVHRVRKYLGAYLATLGGADAIVLTGGIGENSISLRQRILEGFAFAGLQLDPEANRKIVPGTHFPATLISAPHSEMAALVIKTNEELKIAQETAALVMHSNEPDE